MTNQSYERFCKKCREPLGYATISKRLVFFKQHTPIKIFKLRLVRTLYHKNVNSSRCRIRFAINKEKAFLNNETKSSKIILTNRSWYDIIIKP